MVAAADGQRGSAGMLLVVGVLLVAGLLMAAGLVVAVVWAHTRAQATADAVAMDVAGRLLDQADPCAFGDATATANEGRLVDCDVNGDRVAVRVAQPLPAALATVLHRAEATAVARARLTVDFAALPTG